MTKAKLNEIIFAQLPDSGHLKSVGIENQFFKWQKLNCKLPLYNNKTVVQNNKTGNITKTKTISLVQYKNRDKRMLRQK
jgi:hypothetical protein